MNNYFTPAELQCPCCDAMIIDEDFLRRLNHARKIAGIPFTINSAYRCEKHNKAKGSKTNNHTVGKAADIHCTLSSRRYKVLSGLIKAGLMGIGIRRGFIHCDTNRTVPALWID